VIVKNDFEGWGRIKVAIEGEGCNEGGPRRRAADGGGGRERREKRGREEERKRGRELYEGFAFG